MATNPETPLPSLFSLSKVEDLGTRPKIKISEVADEDQYEGSIIEAGWDHDGKVAANLDISDGIAGIVDIRRPSHWGEDSRPESDQIPEYKMGLDAMVRYISKSRVDVIETDWLNGMYAEAALAVEAPAGWIRASRIEKYNGWIEGDVVDIQGIVEDGATVSLRFERAPAADETQTAKIIYFPTKNPELTPAA